MARSGGGSKVEKLTNDALWDQCLRYPHWRKVFDISDQVDEKFDLEFGPFENFSGLEKDFKDIVNLKITNRIKEAKVLSSSFFFLQGIP